MTGPDLKQENSPFSHEIWVNVASVASVWAGTLWMSLGLRAGVQWYEDLLTPSPEAGQEEPPAP